MQKLLLNDFNKIKPFLDEANYEGYNSNFVTMMMWDHEYEIYYEIKEHFLVMLHTYMNEKFFAMPFCKPEYYQEAIEYMLAYAKKNNFNFKIDMIVEDSLSRIKSLYSDKFLYLHNEDFDDYIYTRSSLETLSGKKMQKRRNHFNAFIKNYPDFVYKEIADEDIDNVLQCLKKWDFSHRIEESVISEFIGIVYLLVHREELNIKTGCIYLNGQLEAFIIGSPLKHSTIQIHVEKANKEIRGLYVAICKFFLENNFKGYELVNREEDMGLNSLRKAKQSLHPVKMLKKYTVVLNEQEITQASDHDLHEIIDLWRNSFEDEDDLSANFYFMNCYNKKNTYLLKNSHEIVSMMQIVPYTLVFDNQETKAYFIVGVATKKDYRHQGLMKKLFNYVLELPSYSGQKILLQAYTPALYYQFGFQEDYFHQIKEIAADTYKDDYSIKLIDAFDYDKALQLYLRFVKGFNGYRKRDLEYYKKYLIPRCIAYHDEIKIFYDQTKPIGYAIYHETDDLIEISEIIYDSEASFMKMISKLNYKRLKIECDLKIDLGLETFQCCTMMTNFLKNNFQDNNFYINEIL